MNSPTPLDEAPVSICGGRRVFVKREDAHELGAFKWRGALPTLESYRERGARGVVTASTGNHGAATAWAARRLGLAATVFVPRGASRAKVALIASFGADVRESGSDFDEAKDRAGPSPGSAVCLSSRTATSPRNTGGTAGSRARFSNSVRRSRRRSWYRSATAP